MMTFAGPPFRATISQPTREVLLTMQLIEKRTPVPDGELIVAASVPWRAIVREFERDPTFLHKFDWRRFEELIAAAYETQGYKVTLTPASGDRGRDVIAEHDGFKIRVLDQVKCYDPKYVVTANDVRALWGVLDEDRNASKAILSTTSTFAPGVG
jgi:restriction system protein